MHEWYGPQDELDEQQDEVIAEMLRKRERQGGIVIGYHGTSAANAREIEANGFKNHMSADGRSGVFAWDENWMTNAIYFGKDRAQRLGESEYAIIKVEMTKPEPDYAHGRAGEWKAWADTTKVLEVEYYSLTD